MCGFLGVSGSLEKTKVNTVFSMLKSRGPDQNGIYSDSNFTLLHTRLSIVDTASSPGPYFNEDKSLAIVFNGEIYNYLSLKKTLLQQGHVFKTNTDAEVLLHYYQQYGKECLDALNGQFSFAVYHLKENKVFLARDRLGIKPFYYYKQNNTFAFSSKTQALLVAADIKKQLNTEALKRYLVFRYNDLNETFFKNIYKLPPGSFAIYQNGNLKVTAYYSQVNHLATAISKKEAQEEVFTLLKEAVALRIPKGMSTGIFLSGGIDSSAIFTHLTSLTKDINAYSFSTGNLNDEVNEAKETAAKFGCNVNVVKSSGDSYLLLDKVIEGLSEPVGDAILLPMAHLAKEAVKKQKVTLAGEGADEIFAGYIHQQLFYKFSKFPNLSHLTPSIANILKIIPLKMLNMFFHYPEKLKKADISKIIKILKNVRNFNALKMAVVSLSDVCNADQVFPSDIAIKDYFSCERNILQKGWLADYTLAKLDAVGMAFSLESRVPFLDHNLVNFVNTLPAQFLLNLKNSKIVLREAFLGQLGANIAKRPKKAFYFPYTELFDEGFRDFACSAIAGVSDDVLLMQYIDFAYLAKMIDNVKTLSLFESKTLMNVLIFVVWYQQNFKR